MKYIEIIRHRIYINWCQRPLRKKHVVIGYCTVVYGLGALGILADASIILWALLLSSAYKKYLAQSVLGLQEINFGGWELHRRLYKT